MARATALRPGATSAPVALSRRGAEHGVVDRAGDPGPERARRAAAPAPSSASSTTTALGRQPPHVTARIAPAVATARSAAAALCTHSSYSRAGTESATMPGAGLHVGHAVLDDAPCGWRWPCRGRRRSRGSRRRRRRRPRRERLVARSMSAMARGFGRAGQGARREGRRPARRRRVPPGRGVADDGRLDVHDVAVAPHVHELDDVDGAGAADPLQVVAAEVDEHDVLGALLGVGEQLLGEARRRPRGSCRAGASRRSGG